MRPFRLRWRWILMLALILFAAGGFLLRDLVIPDAAQLAFDRVQPGMTLKEVNEVVARYSPTDHSPFVELSTNSGSVMDVDYRFRDRTVSVHFYQGRVTIKRLNGYPKPTFWDELRAWLNRASDAFHL